MPFVLLAMSSRQSNKSTNANSNNNFVRMNNGNNNVGKKTKAKDLNSNYGNNTNNASSRKYSNSNLNNVDLGNNRSNTRSRTNPQSQKPDQDRRKTRKSTDEDVNDYDYANYDDINDAYDDDNDDTNASAGRKSGYESDDDSSVPKSFKKRKSSGKSSRKLSRTRYDSNDVNDDNNRRSGYSPRMQYENSYEYETDDQYYNGSIRKPPGTKAYTYRYSAIEGQEIEQAFMLIIEKVISFEIQRNRSRFHTLQSILEKIVRFNAAFYANFVHSYITSTPEAWKRMLTIIVAKIQWQDGESDVRNQFLGFDTLKRIADDMVMKRMLDRKDGTSRSR